MMNLVMTGRVEKYQVSQIVTAAIDPTDQMMFVPACFMGNGLIANYASPRLLHI